MIPDKWTAVQGGQGAYKFAIWLNQGDTFLSIAPDAFDKPDVWKMTMINREQAAALLTALERFVLSHMRNVWVAIALEALRQQTGWSHADVERYGLPSIIERSIA